MQLLAFDYQNEQDLEGEDACIVLEGNCTDQIIFDSYNAESSLMIFYIRNSLIMHQLYAKVGFNNSISTGTYIDLTA